MTTTARDPIYAGYRYPAEIISYAVWLYFRFPLSLRMVEEMLAARGISVTHETIRQWGLKFGREFANRIRLRAPCRGDKWHLDEVVISIAGKKHWLWRAVDQDGFVLDVLVQSRRDKKAAKRLFRKVLKKQGRAPRVLVTDKLTGPTALMSQRVNWVLDADLRSFFDSVDHEWLLRMVAHRIADRRILRLIRQWLRAGILESNEWHETDRGTPQGAGISPLLANIFLHYVLDLWVHQWRRRHASGRVSIVRYADDFVMGFEKAADARRMLVDLKDRLAKFGLALHEDKTRLIEFGRLPALRRQQRGERRLETFAFLGFTHYCGWTRDGRFIVKHKTQSKRLTRKLTALRQEAWRHMHAPMAEQQRWYASILRGHYGYYGLPNNSRALSEFHQEVRRIWFRWSPTQRPSLSATSGTRSS